MNSQPEWDDGKLILASIMKIPANFHIFKLVKLPIFELMLNEYAPK